MPTNWGLVQLQNEPLVAGSVIFNVPPFFGFLADPLLIVGGLEKRIQGWGHKKGFAEEVVKYSSRGSKKSRGVGGSS